MNDKFQNKYRIPSIRLQTWDYRWAAAYFITICTQDRVHYFGKIRNGQMFLSHLGLLADVFWHEIKSHAKDIALGEFVVMPNHVHGMLILNPTVVETRHALSLPPTTETIGQNRFQNQGKNSVSSIIGGYKAAVSKHANRLGLPFAWQPRFYDIIVTEEKAFNNISRYIRNNPQNWGKDKFYRNEENE